MSPLHERRPLVLVAGALLLLAAASGCTAPPRTSPERVDDAGSVDDGEGEGEGEGGAGPDGEGEGEGVVAADPFAAQPDTSEGLVNTSDDLEALLEHGALDGACDAWELDKTNRRKKLLCGKAMFFYEGFGTIGVPTSLLEFFGNRFPAISGTAWSGIGLVPDPTHEGLPLGVAPGAPLGNVPTSAFTCASCHFAQLPDGRYSIGAPNHAYDYGAQILAISLPAQSVAPGFDASAHDADAIAKAQPYIDALHNDAGLRIRLLFDLLPLLGAQQPTFTPEIEGHYARWLTGTMDFMMAPLPLDDGAHTVSKILSLWGLASPQEAAAAGMPDEMLAWTGGAESLIEFLDGFVAIGDGTGTTWTHERLSPLQEFLLSLRAPHNPTAEPSIHVERGRALFASTGCLSCHDGPRGMGRRTYPYDEIGTDDAMMAWGDPELDDTYCCNFDGTPTHEVKSPRLVGMWAQGRFLHNGSVASLEELLCLAARTPSSIQAQGSAGHTYGCELSVDDRQALAAYLRSL